MTTIQNFYRAPKDLQNPAYTPDKFLDAMQKALNVKNDAKLCIALDMAPPVASKIRNRAMAVSPGVLFRCAEATGFPPALLRKFLGA